MHCNSHKLNLVISHSCNEPEVGNMLEKIKEVCLFFNASPKREGLLKSVITNEAPAGEKRKAMLNLCVTRWAARHEAYSHFYNAFVFIVKALEVIVNGIHPQYDSENTAGWDYNSRHRASPILKAITPFEFIVTFLWIYRTLAHLEGITVKLQGRAKDILDAHILVEQVKVTYNSMREEVDEKFRRVFQHAERMAQAVGEEPSMPCIASRTVYKSNAPADMAEEYFKRNMAIKFLDHLISELDVQFSDLSRKCSSLQCLVPGSKVEGSSIQDAVDL